MLEDKSGRKIDYARISLTDKCNLRCRYCMPETGVEKCLHSDMLRFEDIYYLIDILKEMGIKKFRFTGGEPFVRRGALEFFENVNLDGFYLTTCLSLKGLDVERINNLKIKGINISLDTLDTEKYRWLTRGGDLNIVLDNIKRLELSNIKINTILMKDFNEDEVMDIIEFARKIGAVVRFIEKMDFIESDMLYVSLKGVKKYLIWKGVIEKESYRDRNSVAVYHNMRDSKGAVGFITPVSEPFCSSCNKIRIKADGDLKLCLFGDDVINLRDMLRNKEDKSKIIRCIKRITLNKPVVPARSFSQEIMANIGG